MFSPLSLHSPLFLHSPLSLSPLFLYSHPPPPLHTPLISCVWISGPKNTEPERIRTVVLSVSRLSQKEITCSNMSELTKRKIWFPSRSGTGMNVEFARDHSREFWTLRSIYTGFTSEIWTPSNVRSVQGLSLLKIICSNIWWCIPGISAYSAINPLSEKEI